ncbi:MAG: transposase [Thermotogaceae bacterium]|nr:transposase [Thermotogaceae bacterium]
MMGIIEEEYGKDPTLGYRRITAVLRKKTGKSINEKRVRRLMKKLGLKGIFPKRKLTKSVKFGIKNEVIGETYPKNCVNKL